MKAKFVIAIMLLMFGAVSLADVTSTSGYDWIKHDCDGATTGFTFNFRVLQASDLVVIHYDTNSDTATTLTNVTDYTISVTNNDYRAMSGGTVTTTSTYGATIDLIISSQFSLTQLAQITYRWQPATVEDALDKSRLIDRQFNRNLLRCLRGPEEDDPNIVMEFGNADERASKWLGFGATGAVVLSDSVTPANAIVSVWGETFIDDADAATARGTIGLDTDDDVEFAEIIGTDVEFAEITGTDLITKSPRHDVRAYGALGNGTDDDTTAIQAALDAANTDGGGIVLCPEGTYLTSSALTIYSDTTLMGVGFETKIIVDATRANIIKTANTATNILVKDLWVYGSGDTNTDERGIFGDSATGLTVHKCKIENMTIGVHFEGCTDGRVLNCLITNIVGASGVTEGYGVLTSSGNDHIITDNCRFKTIARHAIYYGATVSDSIMSNNNIDGTGETALAMNTLEAQTVSKNNIITGNTVKNVTSAANDGHGIVVNTHHWNTIITNNTIDTVNDYGILITSNTAGTLAISKMIHGVIITNNTIDNSVTAIRLINAQDVQITDNIIKTTSDDGIVVSVSGTGTMSYTKNVIISNNQLNTIGDDGIYLAGGTRMTNVILGPNLLTTITATDLVQTAGMVDFQNHLGLIFHEDVVTYADFDTASATPTHNFTITLPAGCILTDVWWNLDTEFAGGSVSAATLELGINGVDDDGIFPAEDVFTGAGTGLKDSAITSQGALLYDPTGGDRLPLKYFCTATRTIKATIRLTGDTGDNLTAGQVRIWIGYYIVVIPTT